MACPRIVATHVSIDEDNVIIADTMITMTSPPSGTAAQWLTYRPLSSLPIVEGDFARLIANGIDGPSAITQQIKFYDQAYGKDSYQTAAKAYFGRGDDEFMKHLGKRIDQKVVFEILTKEGRNEFLAFDRVANRDSMGKKSGDRQTFEGLLAVPGFRSAARSGKTTDG